jgi:hypothetical protein
VLRVRLRRLYWRLDRLPPETSPATRRRIAEYLAGQAATDAW